MVCRIFLAIALCGVTVLNAAECKGPAELERALTLHPTANGLGALGAWFAQHQKLSCAITAFEHSLQLDPNSWETHFNLGLALLETRQDQRAIAEFHAVLNTKPDFVPARNALGGALQSAGKLDEAEAVFRAALQSDSRSVYALDHLAQIYSSERRYGLAIQNWEHATQLAPSDSDLKLSLAIAYVNNGDSEKAIQILTALTKSNPKLALAHFNLATVYADDKRFREAATEYKAALDLDSRNEVARLSLVKAYVSIAAYEDALPFAMKYVADRPSDWEGHAMLGSTYRGLGRYPEAGQELERAVAANGSDYEARYDLGFVLAHEGKAQQALPHLQKALQLRPDSSEARFQLAAVLRALGRTDEANKQMGEFREAKQQSVKTDMAAAAGGDANRLLAERQPKAAAEKYREALRLDPGNAKTWFNLSLALDELGERSEEREALEKALSLDGSLTLAHNQLGLLYAADGKTADAETQFKAAIALDPQLAEAQSNLGVLYGRTGRTREAETLLRKATENNPRLAEAHLNLGLILASEGRLAEAEIPLQKTVQLTPENPTAITALAMVEKKLGKDEAAIQHFQRVIQLQPKSAEAYLNLGIALADTYRLDAALQDFTQAEQLAPESGAPRYNRGRVLLDLHRFEEARQELTRACILAPNYPVSFYLLALADSKLNQYAEAVQTLNRLLILEPRNANAYFLLGNAQEKLGQTQEAVAAWKKTLQLDPNQSEALFKLWRAVARTDPAQGKLYAEQFKALQAQEQLTSQAETLANFGLAAAQRGDYGQAISQLQQAVRECGACTSRAALYKDLGLIECKSGDIQSGEKDLLTAKTLKTQDPDVNKALEAINRMRSNRNLGQ